jgi:hypothetical protein
MKKNPYEEILKKILGETDMEYVGDPQESTEVCRFCGTEASDDSGICSNEKCNAFQARNLLNNENDDGSDHTEVAISVICQVSTCGGEDIDEDQANLAAVEAVTNALEQVEGMGFEHNSTKNLCVGILDVELI